MPKRIALITDVLVNQAGAEKVFAVMCEAFPEADVYTSVYVPELAPPEMRKYHVRELVRGRMFRSEKGFKWLYPLAAAQMLRKPFDDYDLVLSSSAHLGRYIRKGRAKHISYTYYPFRMLYEPERYPLNSAAKRAIVAIARPPLRWWDQYQARQVDRFVAISSASREAIRRHYHRDADIIPSPILTLPRTMNSVTRGDFFLLVSRFEAWKNVQLAVDAFTGSGRRLLIVGDGPQRDMLKSRAGKEVEFLGTVTDSELNELYARARAVIHVTAIEYGLTPIEGNAHGTPAICLGVAGVLETMISYDDDPERATALFFDEPTVDSLRAALSRFDTIRFSEAQCHANAQRFGRETFIQRLRDYVAAHG